jgi:mannose-1-phosphate guanylyltransferase
LSKNIYSKDKEAIILVLPCDHYIKDKTAFLRVLNKAMAVAKKGYIVSLGVTPDRPHTGYGYIKVRAKNKDFYLVDRFIEKPNLKKAKEFLKDKRFYWNGGIFIFRAKIMLEEIKKLAPYDYGIIAKIKDKKSLNRLWPKFTSISIDYAIMQKCKKMAVIPADFGWIDLGSWRAIEQLAKKDLNGNIFKGKCIDLDSRNTLVWSDSRLLATLGLENIIAVATKDVVLVCAKDRTQDVKKLVEILKEKKLKALL